MISSGVDRGHLRTKSKISEDKGKRNARTNLVSTGRETSWDVRGEDSVDGGGVQSLEEGEAGRVGSGGRAERGNGFDDDVRVTCVHESARVDVAREYDAPMIVPLPSVF